MAEYGKYFTSATVTSATTSFYNYCELISSDRTWNELVNEVMNTILLEDTNGGYTFGSALPTVVSGTVKESSIPYKIYTPNSEQCIVFTLVFINQSDTKKTYTGYFTFNGFALSGSTLNGVKQTITNTLNASLGSNTAEAAYIQSLSIVNCSFAFGKKENFQYVMSSLKNPSDPGNILYTTIPNLNLSFNSGSTTTRQLTITMTKAKASITTNLSRFTIRNLNTNGSAFRLNKQLSYSFVPKTLSDRSNVDYNKGKIGGTSLAPSINHQDYMNDDAKTIIGDIVTQATVTGTLATSNYSVYPNLVASFIDDGEGFLNITQEMTWTTPGYNFYRDSGKTMDVTTNNTFINSETTLNIYPDAISSVVSETMYVCLYDIDEGQISYINNGYDLLNRYYVPPTDILNYQANASNLNYQTKKTYAFDTLQFKYGTSTINYSNTYADLTPSYLNPSIGIFKFTSAGETFPQNLTGILTCSSEYYVVESGNRYFSSVRYHEAGSAYNKGVYGNITSGQRSSKLYIGVQKNTLDFINNFTLMYPSDQYHWDDTISDIHYYEPIAYANKLSTMNDLADKLTCFHGRAAYYYLNSTSYKYLYQLKNWFLTQLWTGGCNFSTLYGSNSSTSTPVRYRTITINGSIYSEINWPMRYYRYPTWTSATATSFSYNTGLVIKYKQGMVSSWNQYAPDIVLFNSVNETTWNNAIKTSQSVSSGAYYLLKYNGYIVYASAGTYPFTTITSNSISTWNRDRRAIGNVERKPDGSANFYPNDNLVNWIYDTTSNFNDSIGQSYDGHRVISDNGDGIATNDGLYYEDY